MKRYAKNIAIGILIFLLFLLVVLSLGYVPISMGVMYSLFISILFVLALIVIPQAFEHKPKKK